MNKKVSSQVRNADQCISDLKFEEVVGEFVEIFGCKSTLCLCFTVSFLSSVCVCVLEPVAIESFTRVAVP